MSRCRSRTAGRALVGLALCLAALPMQAAQLKKETAAAWDRYLAASEKRIAAELQNGPFLFIDAWPEAKRKAAYAQLHDGAVLVEQENALEEGQPVEVPHGLIHDWQGVLFIPHATVAETLAVLQDYDRYQDYFRPEIRRSRLLSRNGDDFRIALQLYKKSVITVAIDADFNVHFERLGPNRMADRACATRLAQVADPDQPDAQELAPGEGDGFLWRLCDFRRFEERDGGVYMQLESMGLSRGVPWWIAWLVDPLLKSIPRGELTGFLTATRTAIGKQGAGNGQQGGETASGTMAATEGAAGLLPGEANSGGSSPGGGSALCSQAGFLFPMLAHVVGREVGIELAHGRKGNVTHDGIAELGGKNAEGGRAGRVVVTGDKLGKRLAAEAGDVGRLPSVIGAGDRLLADDVERPDGDAVAGSEGVVAGVFVEDGGEKPRREKRVVGLVDKTAPDVLAEPVNAFAERGVLVGPLREEGGEAEKEERGVVEGLMGGDGEVVFEAGRRGLGSAGNGTEIGHEAEDAGRLAAFEGDGVAVGVDGGLGPRRRGSLGGGGLGLGEVHRQA